ncbi:MAG: RraA family protein [Hyphomicrobiales bacterium]|nr:RraA family protein [Hyphomicrobiales bacterium]
MKETLYTAVLSDVLDELGHPNRALRPFVRPLDESLVLLGKARTGLYTNTYSVIDGENPYELEIQLIDDLKPGEVPVLGCDGPTDRLAPWGELLTTAALARGAVGCVTDGLVRDVRMIRDLGFPVFHGGIGPLDSRGRGKMVEIDRPVDCGGVRVRSGDILFGDVDGVVAVPQDVAEEAFRLAFVKATAENHTRDELREGSLLADVYAKYGVL